MSSEIQIRQDEPGDILKLIGVAATDSNVSVEKMERLFSLQERWENRKAAQAFQQAMIAARAEMPEVGKDSKGENCRYAKLEKIDRVVYPIYTKHGFSLQWSEAAPDKDQPLQPGWTRLRCVVLHSGGHREEHFLAGPMDDKGPKGAANKTGIQGMGSTWSYLQRRLLAMIFNIRIVGDDNDGQAQKHEQGAIKLSPAEIEKAARKDAATKLWQLLLPVRGKAHDWNDAESWMKTRKIIQPDQSVLTLTALQIEDAYGKAWAELETQRTQ